VALSVALLSEARIQSVTGLEELTGEDGGIGGPWLYAVAAVAVIGFLVVERRVSEPLIDLDLLFGPLTGPAMLVNALIGAGLIIAMVDVPLFVNVVEGDLKRSAVIAGGLLTALTGTMALASYLGGRLTGRTGYRAPTVAGLLLAVAAFALMGATWDPDTDYAVMAVHLAMLGTGIGLVIAPTTAAVVDDAPPDRRGTFAGLVIQLRLVGFSIGLAALTAWGTHRFNQLRAELDLPPLSEPGARSVIADAEVEITTSALAETFIGAAVVMALALGAALLLRARAHGPEQPPPAVSHEQPGQAGHNG
jgi:MFS family permease